MILRGITFSWQAQYFRQVDWKKSQNAMVQVDKMTKYRRIASFWMLSSSKNQEVSQNCFIFDVVNFETMRKSAEELRFKLAARQIDKQTDRQTDSRQTEIDR